MEGAMSRPDIITFMSDSGWSGAYVAACEGTMVTVRPQARVFHISHEVPAGDVAAGALTLQRVAPLFPCAVHLAVVDPGVGTARRPIVVACGRGDMLVGPDNGLLLGAAEALGGLVGAWDLDPAAVRRWAGLPVDKVSFTFHGRDIFSPAAAVLAGSGDPSSLGTTIDPASLVRLAPPVVEHIEGGVIAQVVEIDRFGNTGLALRFADLPPGGGEFVVEVPGEDLPEWRARVVRTFGDLHPGELGVYCDSWGQTALTLNSASAAQLLTLERGMRVQLTVAHEPDPGLSVS
jgi:S-adenosylmethionine hydrolase